MAVSGTAASETHITTGGDLGFECSIPGTHNLIIIPLEPRSRDGPESPPDVHTG